jgi:hypothetical protein
LVNSGWAAAHAQRRTAVVKVEKDSPSLSAISM